ncbi:hypothetical protein FS799_21625 [Agrobacterium vitis]|uniref:hypothetical protein n=1 Tax=Agrobacterium vitis TaxID=373 RepID=UPI001F3343C8|nr:hypothetical protein [Agrobacterium vitis]MCE6077450.1 hypothetical protein [Agrobacterium vitis]
MVGFGEAEARKLLQLGWRQGSTFIVQGRLAELTGFAEGEIVVVLTQSCSVVSTDLVKDPFVEIALLARETQAYSAKSQNAVGKNMRKLSIPLDEDGKEIGFLVDINARRFLGRELFLDFAPDGPQSSVAVGEKIGRWIGSTYSRAALPNNLVDFFRAAKFNEVIEAVLKSKYEGNPIHGSVRSMHADWSSDEEVDFYDLRIDFLCDDELVSMEFNERLESAFGGTLPDIAKSGKLNLRLNVKDAVSTSFNEFDHMRRFSDWDFFSGLADDMA